ncbi:elongin-C-like [Talpa occidentalis]|uniref:elongin-C-like n=1 Tax=Talpa occidentalis TaxID=50954 RepID=UPI00188FD151|nr:elongin-C-like [Talpa occidentalis]
MYVKLISHDGHEFIVKREQAPTSGTIEATWSGPSQFATNEISLRAIPSQRLSKGLCVHCTNSWTEIPEFPIASEIALQLLMTTNLLDC